MKKCRIAACILMLLAAVMAFLPYIHVDVPKFSGKKLDYTASGISLVKNSMGLTKNEFKDAIKQVRNQLKDYPQLDEVYDFLGDAASLLTWVKICAFVCFCLPGILLIVGTVLGLMIKSKKGAFISLVLDAAAMLIHGISGIAGLWAFHSLRKQVVDAVREMEDMISEGLQFFGSVTVEDTSFAISQKIERINLQLQYGWIAFLVLSLIAVVFWILAVMQKETAKETPGSPVPGDVANDSVEKSISKGIVNNPPWNDLQNSSNAQAAGGMQNIPTPGNIPQVLPQVNDPETSWVGLNQARDINSYLSLCPFNPNQPRGIVRGLEGNYSGMELPAANGKLVFGRDPKLASVVFDKQSDRVSRRHCEIWFDGSRYHLKDFSTNGVFIHILQNGSYISYSDTLPKNVDNILVPGTMIDIGNDINRFRLE